MAHTASAGTATSVEPAGTEAATTPPHARCRVLLAEDNPVNRMVATEMLEVLGCAVTSAGNGEEALQCWRDAAYDLVFMDCQMPTMDGMEATRRMRAAERQQASGAHTPIVALTANALPSDRLDCLAAGMDDHLAKPFSIAELDERISHWTGTPSPLAPR